MADLDKIIAGATLLTSSSSRREIWLEETHLRTKILNHGRLLHTVYLLKIRRKLINFAIR